jgi:hypothetical protein
MGACSNNDIKISVVVFDSCMKRLCDAVGGVPMAENQPERNKIGLGIGGGSEWGEAAIYPKQCAAIAGHLLYNMATRHSS